MLCSAVFLQSVVAGGCIASHVLVHHTMSKNTDVCAHLSNEWHVNMACSCMPSFVCAMPLMPADDTTAGVAALAATETTDGGDADATGEERSDNSGGNKRQATGTTSVVAGGSMTNTSTAVGAGGTITTGGTVGVTSGSTAARALCSYGYDLELRRFAATPFCETRKLGKYGSPGGVVCEGAGSIAECPRPWEWRT